MNAGGAPDLDGQLMWTVTRAAHHVERAASALLAPYGLSPVQFGVLMQLSTHSALTNAELARLCLVRPQSMAGVVNGMAKRGQITRDVVRGRGNPNRITLTDLGRGLVDEVWPVFVAANQPEVLGLDAADAVRLNDMLHELRGLPLASETCS